MWFTRTAEDLHVFVEGAAGDVEVPGLELDASSDVRAVPSGAAVDHRPSGRGTVLTLPAADRVRVSHVRISPVPSPPAS